MTGADVWHATRYDDSLSFREHLQRIPGVPIDTIYQLFKENRDWSDNKMYWIPCKADPPGELLIYVDCITEEHPPWHYGEHGTNSPGKHSLTEP